MLAFFIILQFILLAFMLFHDWIPVPPFNDIKTLKKTDSNFYRFIGSLINGAFVAIPLTFTIMYFNRPHIPICLTIIVTSFYFFLTLGTILSWWVPYIFGSSVRHKVAFNKFKHTHHFLPKRKDNVVPNTLHVVLHLQVWACLGISVYYLLSHL